MATAKRSLAATWVTSALHLAFNASLVYCAWCEIYATDSITPFYWTIIGLLLSAGLKRRNERGPEWLNNLPGYVAVFGLPVLSCMTATVTTDAFSLLGIPALPIIVALYRWRKDS